MTSRLALVPHFRRPSVVGSVRSLLATDLVDEVMIVTMGDGDAHLAALSDETRIRIVRHEAARFCKAHLLNVGLKLIPSGHVLVCDADILWDTTGLRELIESVERGPLDLAWIRQVGESGRAVEPDRDASHRRLGFRVVCDGDNRTIEIFDDDANGARPGYGLLYGDVDAFRRVGGYKSGWGGGWGWEDIDLIIRAQLLGLAVASAGSAVHLTHADDLRAIVGGSKAESRDANVEKSRSDICAGRLEGDLVSGNPVGRIAPLWRDARSNARN